MNKKGLGDALMWFVKISMLSGIILFVVYMMSVSVSVAEVRNLEAEILAHRLFVVGLSYTDSVTGRVYPGIVDMEKFTPDMFKTLALDKDALAFRVSAESIDTTFTTKPLYSDEVLYQDMDALSWSPRYTKKEQTIYVLLRRNGNSIIPGILHFSYITSTGGR